MENGPRTSMPTLDFVLNLKAPTGPLGHPLAVEIQKARPAELPGFLAALTALTALAVLGATGLAAPAPTPARAPEVAATETVVEEVKEVPRVVSEHVVQAPVVVEETTPPRPARRTRRRAASVEAAAAPVEAAPVAAPAAPSLEDLMRRASGEDPLR